MSAVYAVCLTALGFWHYGKDYWHTKWALLLGLIILELGRRIGKSLSWALGACFAYSALSSLYIFAWRDNYLSQMDKVLATSLESVTASTLVAFLLLAGFLASQTDFKPLERAFAALCFIDSAFVLLSAYLAQGKRYSVGGFFDQDSMNGCFIAVTFPFLIKALEEFRHSYFPAFVAITAMIITAIVGIASNAFGVACVVLTTLFFRPTKKAVLTLAGILLGSVFAMHFLNPELWDSSGRFQMYRLSLQFLSDKDPWHWVFGMGNGSFPILGPAIQMQAHFLEPNWFLWLHSDWLELLFEQGLLGLSLYVWLFVQAALRAYDAQSRTLLASLLGFASSALFQYPIHLSLFGFVGMSTVVMCLRAPSLEASK